MAFFNAVTKTKKKLECAPMSIAYLFALNLWEIKI